MSSDFRRACVSGGAGFIGSHLARALLARGLEVVVLDDLSVGRAENVPAGARLVRGDVLDAEAARDAASGCDVVFHLAARVAIRSSFEFAVEDARINFVGTVSMLRAAHAAGGVRRFVGTSSMAVYADAPSPDPIPETHPTAPISPYGISKLGAEQLVHTLGGQAGFSTAVLRLFNTYGPGQALSPYVGVVTIFANALLRGEAPSIFGDGEQRRDFVHVDDVVRAFVGALDAPVSGETFNVGTGVATSVNEVFAAVRAALGSTIEARSAPAVTGEVRYSIADIGKARRLLGYRPANRFADSIGAVVAEIRAATQPS